LFLKVWSPRETRVKIRGKTLKIIVSQKGTLGNSILRFFLRKILFLEGRMTGQISTSDLYEAGFYFIQGFKLERVDVVNQNRKEMGRFTFSGDGIQKAQLVYFNGEATVNLMDFRRTYLHLNTLVGKAKKETKKAESPESL
jgi:hypothetical protein